MMTKQRGWIPILKQTVSPTGRNREDGSVFIKVDLKRPVFL